MTPKQIVNLVEKEADVRFNETVERLFSILQERHTHLCGQHQCECEYCHFINDIYVPEKLRLHRIKKQINFADNNIDRLDWHWPEQMLDELKFSSYQKKMQYISIKKTQTTS